MRYIADFKSMPARLVPVPLAAPLLPPGFVPGTKAKLLETIAAMRPDYDMRPLKGYSKRRLYAIYFKVRHNIGR